MSSFDLAACCRRLAREMIGDPMEVALLRLAEECEAARSHALPIEPPDRPLPAAPQCR